MSTFIVVYYSEMVHKKGGIILKTLHERVEKEVYPMFPLLRPVIDQAGENHWAGENPCWKSFLDLRQKVFSDGGHPAKDNIDKVDFIANSVLWFKSFQKACGVHEEMKKLGNGDLLSNYTHNFRLVLSPWRTEWQNLLERFIPIKYRDYFNDREGLVSVMEDPYALLHTSRSESYDNPIWQYRRYLARRDWFLTHLGMILSVYRNAFNYYSIAIELDNKLRLDNANFMGSDFSLKYNLPARVLNWKGKDIFVHCDWNSKSLSSLVAKVLMKQYHGYTSLYEDIYDVFRGRLVVEADDMPFICAFIEEFTDLKREEDKENPFSSADWKVVRYKGYFHSHDPLSKFEFQVQEVNDYLLAEYGDNPANHISYKGRQFLTLLTIMLPPVLLEKFFGLNVETFRVDYDNWLEKLVALDSLAYD